MTLIIGIRVVEVTAVGVHVPARNVKDRIKVVDRHEPRAALDQPAGHQAGLAKRVSAIPVPQLVVLFAKVESPLGFRRREQAKRSSVGGIKVPGRLRLDTPLQVVDLGQ